MGNTINASNTRKHPARNVPFWVTCAGRHAIPETIRLSVGDTATFQGYIWDAIQNPLDMDGLYRHAYRFLEKGGFAGGGINVVVTGLTSAILAIVRAALDIHVDVCFLHFDRESGEYVPQMTVYPANWDWDY